MVWYRIMDALSGEPKLPPGPTQLPDYFPVEPRGCESHAQKLFACVTQEATEKARDLEKLGYYKPYFDDVEPPTPTPPTKNDDEKAQKLPQPGDNPLDECRSFVAYYKRCCDRELKKKKNWLLTEPFRVQKEYRYQDKSSGGGAATKTN